MDYYIVFVLIAFAVCFIVIPTIMDWIGNHPKFNCMDKDSILELRIAVFILALLSPIVYEFKKFSPQINQCEIFRDETGSVIGLRKDAKGFHRPFYGDDKFVILPKSFQTKHKITFPADGCLVDISYDVVCLNPMNAYIISNGKICNQDFPYSHLANDFFQGWLDDGFRLVLLGSEKNNKPPTKPEEIYSWFVDKAKVWSDTNNASCRIEVESFDKIQISNFYATEIE